MRSQSRNNNENTQTHNSKISNSSNVSPVRNFFSQPAQNSLIKALVAVDITPQKKEGINQQQQSNSRSPFQKHNVTNSYSRYLVPQANSKPRQLQVEGKKSKSYIQTNNDSSSLMKKTTNNNSTPTQPSANEDDSSLNQKKMTQSQTHKRGPSKVFVETIQPQSRPNSGISKKQTSSQNVIQVQPVVASMSAQNLIQKIKDHYQTKRPQQQSQLLQYHQELIDKQYKKLLELQQHYQSYKQKKGSSDIRLTKLQGNQKQYNTNQSAIITSDLSNHLMQYIKNQSNSKKIKGYRSISNPDIGTQLAKKLTQLTSTSVLTQPGVLHTGQIKNNQDSYFLKENLLGLSNCWLLQVSDGHGTNGHLVAQFVRDKLPNFIEMQMKQKKVSTQDFSADETDSLVNTSLRLAFERTSRELYSSGIDITFSGATTVTVVILENEVWCANIGDSRAIIARALDRQTLQVVELSNDHKPDTPTEAKRIVSSGGRIQPYSDQDGNPIGPARVWLKEESIPGLAMARSFGDYVASQVGVISVPEIIKHTIRPQDKFLVIASDGIWEFLSNDWIVNTVFEYYLKNDVNGACKRLVEEATLAWEREDEVIDDITCIVAFIGQNLVADGLSEELDDKN